MFHATTILKHILRKTNYFCKNKFWALVNQQYELASFERGSYLLFPGGQKCSIVK